MLPRIFIYCCFAIAPLTGLAQDDAGTVAAPPEEKPAAAVPAARAPEAPAMPQNKEERDQMQKRAQQLNADAKSIKEAAAVQYEAAQKACWERFLVSSCLEDERQAFRKEERRAKQLESDARLLNRNVKRFDAGENTTQRAAENARKEAENEARAAKFRADQEARQKP